MKKRKIVRRGSGESSQRLSKLGQRLAEGKRLSGFADSEFVADT